ncbi:MAG: decarboxylating 6-phosphogluconate dehydrogenase [Gammaproteobacteria bacterium]|nr:decarboxylating 6-phosphogluconate dehydrogenase [Gammaproteobacteria bacterium]MCF6230525.1 decarboxylating 6-phosphogluconate dehydrogenase [Gammaproteobacteria bacterium]
MKMALIGLGKMGGNMARRLRRGGIDVIGFNRSPEIVNTLASEEGMIPATSVNDAISKLEGQRIIWLMLPCGEPTEQMIQQLIPQLNKGDIVIDGGNSNFHDTQRRHQMLAEHGISFMDAGTSGGVWGLDNGYCMMVGGSKENFATIEPIIKVLAPSEKDGWIHAGPCGSGHYTKMIHNGIEYGMMQAMAEGFAIMESKKEFNLDLAALAESWRHGSVVRSWLLDLTADFLKADQKLTAIDPYVSDSGEGRWTCIEAIDQGIYAPVLSLAIHARFASQGNGDYGNKMLSMMRNAFGGHAMKSAN